LHSTSRNQLTQLTQLTGGLTADGLFFLFHAGF
jgi:hypothetical protein